MSDFWVNGIVAVRDGKPYIQLSNDKGMIAQLSMSEARQVAGDIVKMCSRAESAAKVHRFYEGMDYEDLGHGKAERKIDPEAP